MESDLKPDEAKQMRGLQLILEQPNRGRIFVLRHNGKILGMINLLFTISTAEGGFVVMLEDVIVHRDQRHQGIGAKLLSHAIEYAKTKNFLRITLLTDRLNVDSHPFFKSHGFFTSEMCFQEVRASIEGSEGRKMISRGENQRICCSDNCRGPSRYSQERGIGKRSAFLAGTLLPGAAVLLSYAFLVSAAVLSAFHLLLSVCSETTNGLPTKSGLERIFPRRHILFSSCMQGRPLAHERWRP